MKTIYEITKEVALLIAGAFLAILVIPYERQISNELLPIAVALIFLALYGIGLIDWIAILAYRVIRTSNQKKEKIAILLPYAKERTNFTWVDVSLKDMTDLLTRKGIKYQIEIRDNAFKKQGIVMNPYGGVYPENDLSKLESLETIFDFVQNGGIYINIADIPFYYAFDKKLNRRVDTTPLAGDFSVLRSFFHTILTEKLHCLVIGKPKEIEAKRVIELPEPTSDLFGLTFDEGGVLFSPVVRIAFGKGFFIFSTLHLNSGNLEIHLMRVINAAISLRTPQSNRTVRGR